MEKMWRLNRPLRRNRSLEHHQRCLNLVSTNTRGLGISTASHSQNSVKCCVCSGVIVSSLILGFPPSLLTSFNRSDVAAGAFRIVTILGVKFHSDVTHMAVNDEIWTMAEVSVTIVVACCPLLRPLLEKLIPKRLAQWAHARK